MWNSKFRYDYMIVGCGLTGIVLAEQLAKKDKIILIIDKRNHIGGNCYDYVNDNIIVQKYGPHIFHTNDEEVWKYLSQFTRWIDYEHKVLSYHKDKYYEIPINRTTINQFYNIDLKTNKDVREFLNHKKYKIKIINNSEDVVLSKVGFELYNAFILSYTKKQWNKFPDELDKSVLERIPVRYDENPYYFTDKHQGLPQYGYTEMFEKMLKNPKITVALNVDFNTSESFNYKKLIYTGCIDDYYNYKYGYLEYRNVIFDFKKHKTKHVLPSAVINYPDRKHKYSRRTEFKYFYNISSPCTIICTEYFSNYKGILAYPVPTKQNNELLQKYINEYKTNLIFAGRLGTYKYLNMDVCIRRALDIVKKEG